MTSIHCSRSRLMSAVLRRSNPRNLWLGLQFFPLGNPRLFSSGTEARAIKEGLSRPPIDDLRGRIFRLRFPKRSATEALEKWVGEGRKVTASELRQITGELRRSRRYEHALEILTWMESRGRYHPSPLDHATRLDLIVRSQNLPDAEAYFEKLTDGASRKSSALPLLHYYIKERDSEKAEALFTRLQSYGLLIDPHPFNEMMKLYMATDRPSTVLAVIRHMKQSMIPLNVLSYNLWMTASGEISGVSSSEAVIQEMMADKNVEPGWSSYANLANIYTKHGLVEKSLEALREAEAKLSSRKRLGHSFLMTSYAALGDSDGVLRLWGSSKRVVGRVTCKNYMCALLCFVNVGDISEAERVFETWESEQRRYDVRVSNVLLGVYTRNGWMDKAESLHLRVIERGGCPNYKTWEILMEGWVKSGEMSKAVEAMKNGFSLLKDCEWRPGPVVVAAIAGYFEERGDVSDARKYIRVLRRFRLMSLGLYKSFIRTHLNADVAVPDVLQMMSKDGIVADEEVMTLVHCDSKATSVHIDP